YYASLPPKLILLADQGVQRASHDEQAISNQATLHWWSHHAYRNVGRRGFGGLLYGQPTHPSCQTRITRYLYLYAIRVWGGLRAGGLCPRTGRASGAWQRPPARRPPQT